MKEQITEVKKFQNLIGMLGRGSKSNILKEIFFVSKPYRYARKV